jgi:hypothetical protein
VIWALGDAFTGAILLSRLIADNAALAADVAVACAAHMS